MKHRIASVSAVALLALTACGGGDAVSSQDARRIVVSGLIDAGHSPAVSSCSADAALGALQIDELVNSNGTTSDAANAEFAAIVAACTRQQTPPSTPAPATTAPSTGSPTVPPSPVELSAPVCRAASDVVVMLDAARLMDRPTPQAQQAWFDEALDRTELAILTAPDGAIRDVALATRTHINELHDLLGSAGFDASAPETEAAAPIVDELQLGADELRTLLGGCDIDVDDMASAAELLAEQLTELGESPGSTGQAPGSADEVAVDHAEADIMFTVPSAWSGEAGGVGATAFGELTRFVVRAPDPAVFTDPGRTDGLGVAVYALDDTVDYEAMLAAGSAANCTLADETPYDDGLYVGVRREYTECAGTPVTIVVVGAADTEAEVAAYVEIRADSLDDAAIDLVLGTFYV